MRQVEIASNHQIVTPAELEYQSITFSPDGNYVYYVIFDNKSEPVLYKVAVLGGIATRVIENVAVPKFSPDGKQIVFKRFYQDQQEEALVIANADGTGEQKLVSHKEVFGWWYRSGLAWSPDGQVIACSVGSNVVAVNIEHLLLNRLA